MNRYRQTFDWYDKQGKPCAPMNSCTYKWLSIACTNSLRRASVSDARTRAVD